MIPRYVDDSIIGEGGFGQVAICTDRATGQQYAKKTLLPGATPDQVERFVREVKLLSRLGHENIVSVFDSRTTAPPYYFIMPLYRVSLEKELWDISLQQHRAVPIFNRILAGVAHAHQNGVIHRDLKPQNVLLNTDMDVVVSDFGLGRQLDSESTRHTMSGWGMGTLLYSPPEQWSNAKDADVRADVYSLGVILYTLHVGTVNYLDANHAKLPGNLRPVVRRATQPERENRFATVAELQEAWVSASGQRITASTVAQMNAILSAMVSDLDATGLVDRLHDLMVSNLDDRKVIFEVTMKLPAQAVALMETRYPETFHSIIRLFAAAVADPFMNHNYNFMDVIGKQCRAIYDASQDAEVRAEILSSLFVLGYENHRFFVMKLFHDIVQQAKQPGEGLMIVGRIRGRSPDWIEKAKKELSPARLDYHLRELFFPDDPAEPF